MKYQPLRLVSWVNSTQCSFKPIKRLQMSNINGHHQPAGFGLVLKCHLRCIFWEQQIDTLEIYILVCLHYVSKSNLRNQGFLFEEKTNSDSRSWLFLSRQYRSLWIPLNSYRINPVNTKEGYNKLDCEQKIFNALVQAQRVHSGIWIHLSFKGRITLPLPIYLKIYFGR